MLVLSKKRIEKLTIEGTSKDAVACNIDEAILHPYNLAAAKLKKETGYHPIFTTFDFTNSHFTLEKVTRKRKKAYMLKKGVLRCLYRLRYNDLDITLMGIDYVFKDNQLDGMELLIDNKSEVFKDNIQLGIVAEALNGFNKIFIEKLAVSDYLLAFRDADKIKRKLKRVS